MLGPKIGRCEFPVHLRVDSRHRKANSGQHVVCGDIVNVVLIDLGAHDNPIIVILLTPSPRCALLFDCLRPPCRIIIRE